MRRSRLSTTLCALVVVGALASCGESGPTVLSLQPAGAERTANDAAGMVDGIVDVAYDLADDVRVSEKSAHAYRVIAPADVAKTVAALGKAVGLSGKPTQDESGTWTLGVDDSTASGLWVYTTFGPPSWSYFSGMASSASRAVVEPCDPSRQDCAPDAPTTDTPDSSPAPSTSSTVPPELISEADARARAAAILTALGYSSEAIEFTSSTDEWGTHVVGRLSVDGRDASTMAFFDYGDKGKLIAANGFLGSYEEADSYTLIDLDEAVSRLTMPLYAGGLVARDLSAEATSDSATSDSATNDSATSNPVAEDSVPGWSSIAPKTVVVPITRADVVLSLAWLSDQSTVLVPSYRFSNDDGEVGTVYAIESKYLQQASVDDGQGSGSQEPFPVPGSAVVDPSPGQSSGGSPGQNPGDMTPIAQRDAETLLGLTETEAMKVVDQRGWVYRVVERDGESLMVTADYVTNRVNVVVTKGRITDVSVG